MLKGETHRQAQALLEAGQSVPVAVGQGSLSVIFLPACHPPGYPGRAGNSRNLFQEARDLQQKAFPVVIQRSEAIAVVNLLLM